MSGYIGKININNVQYPVAQSLFGTCDTTADTAIKVVTCADFDTLISGIVINVYFTYANTNTSISLNVNGTGEKVVYVDSSSMLEWEAGATKSFVYYNNQWRLINPTSVGTTYSAATTAANGLMSSSDKIKLNGIDEKYVPYIKTSTGSTNTVIDAPENNWFGFLQQKNDNSVSIQGGIAFVGENGANFSYRKEDEINENTNSVGIESNKIKLLSSQNNTSLQSITIGEIQSSDSSSSSIKGIDILTDRGYGEINIKNLQEGPITIGASGTYSPSKSIKTVGGGVAKAYYSVNIYNGNEENYHNQIYVGDNLQIFSQDSIQLGTNTTTTHIYGVLDPVEDTDAVNKRYVDNSIVIYGTGTLAQLETGTDTSNQVWQAKTLHDYISGVVGAADAMRFKGTIGEDGDISSLPTSNVKIGDTYRVVTAGTYASQTCEVGDLIIAISTTPTWTVAQTNIDGAITSINGTAPIQVSGSGNSRTISIATATTASAGAMSAADKQALGKWNGVELNKSSLSTNSVTYIPYVIHPTNSTTAYFVASSGTPLGDSIARYNGTGYLISTTPTTSTSSSVVATTQFVHNLMSTIPTYSVATTATDGLMSAQDKIKLDNLNISDTYSASSTSAMSGIAVAQALSGPTGNVTTAGVGMETPDSRIVGDGITNQVYTITHNLKTKYIMQSIFVNINGGIYKAIPGTGEELGTEEDNNIYYTMKIQDIYSVGIYFNKPVTSFYCFFTGLVKDDLDTDEIITLLEIEEDTNTVMRV